MVGNRFKWNSYDDENLVCAFDMSTRTAGGLMKNLAKTGAVYDAIINGTWRAANPLIRAKRTPCWDLDGANDFLSLANPISGLTVFSIVGWVNYDAYGGMLFSRAGAASSYYYYYDYLGAGYPSYYVGGVGFLGPYQSQKVPITRTLMFVAIRDVAGVARIFHDGKVFTVNTVGAAPVDANAFIGQYWNGTSRLNGRLDNMMFYDRALNASQVWSLYRSSIPR